MKNRKILIVSAMAVALILAGIGGTYAYLSDSSQTVVNTFLPGQVPPGIVEEFNGILKQNVRITNQGNVSAFVRAAVVVSWKDEQGNIGPDVPALGLDYTLEFASEGWEKQGDYYYCLSSVAPGEETPVLIQTAEQLRFPEGYSLVLEILAQTIQAEGVDFEGRKPVMIAWGVDIQDGNLTAVSGVVRK